VALRQVNIGAEAALQPRSQVRPMHHLFEPSLVNGPGGEPGLFVDLREQRRALLFDLGDIAPLPPRKLLRISHVFVSHTHMDHFIGFDALLRVLLGRKERIVLFGGPGFVDQIEHKLRAYSWNVVHRYAPLVLEVHEVGLAGERRHACFASLRAFAREPATPPQGDEARRGEVPHDDVLCDEVLWRVRGRFVDHEMPCLAFALEAKARPRVAQDRLAALGLSTGAWLRELKAAVLAGAPPQTPIRVQWRDRAGEHSSVRHVGELAEVILDIAPGERLGYVTDLRFTAANRATLAALLQGVDRLYIESVFLDADREQAARKNHLTARQAGTIAREVGARSVVPFHFSPRYDTDPGRLATEVHDAWSAPADSETRPE
jgi:ribonuclease Z